MRYIIVGNSLYKTFHKIYRYQEGDYFIGLDEGSLQIINNNYPLNEAWGDFDSGNNIKLIKSRAIKFYEYPKEKNETDLELVLMNLKTDDEILLYDVTGSRLDHELINILLLKKYSNLNIVIIDELNDIRYYSKEKVYTLDKDDYRYVSLITLNNATIKISQGLYLLDKVTITSNDTYTSSNEFIDGKFIFELYRGDLLVIRSK